MWANHVPEKDYFYNVLKGRFSLEISSRPEYLFYSVFGHAHATRRFDGCVKIFYTGENVRPDMDACDFALSFDHLQHPRHLRFPLYVCYQLNHDLAKSLPLPESLAARSFCNFVYTNGRPQERIAFFRALSAYKRVDSGGGLLNNIGRKVDDKISFLRQYKFTIAFENSSYPGYTTEKLVQPMVACSLPIYWGNPRVGDDFNRESFLVADSADFGGVIEKIVALDRDDAAYLEMLSRPWFPGGVRNEYCQPGYIVPFFERVFEARPGTMRRSPECWRGFR